jgi:hypothetical protein
MGYPSFSSDIQRLSTAARDGKRLDSLTSPNDVRRATAGAGHSIPRLRNEPRYPRHTPGPAARGLAPPHIHAIFR